jgi:hypothetical protein
MKNYVHLYMVVINKNIQKKPKILISILKTTEEKSVGSGDTIP